MDHSDEELKVIAEMLGGLIWNGKVHVLAPSLEPGECKGCSLRASRGGCVGGLVSEARCKLPTYYHELKT